MSQIQISELNATEIAQVAGGCAYRGATCGATNGYLCADIFSCTRHITCLYGAYAYNRGWNVAVTLASTFPQWFGLAGRGRC